MRRIVCLAQMLAITASSMAGPSVPASRRSPEFTISECSGKPILLSSLKGKVVVMEFL
jgi:hypothetical protein